jgi:hypothetical protein
MFSLDGAVKGVRQQLGAYIHLTFQHSWRSQQLTIRILIGTSTLQIMLSTVHAVLALVLLIEGFIQTQNIPQGAFLYWINPSTKAQVITKAVYIGNVCEYLRETALLI